MALTRPRYSQIFDTDYKQSVRLATTTDVGNLLVSGNITSSVDTITVVVGDRILVKDQVDARQNGIYRVVTVGGGTNGTWIRAQDADSDDKVSSGMTTTVSEGAVNSAKTFKLSTADPITVGTTNLTFVDPFVVTATAGGSINQVQFNDTGGTLNGSPGFTFNKSSNAVSVAGSISTANISVNGNVSATLFFGNGSQLTGLPAGYSNVQVATYLPTHTGVVTSSNVFVTGNITAQYVIGDGSQLSGIDSTAIKNTTNSFVITHSNGNVTVKGNLVPSANLVYDLGSPTQRWNVGYFAGNTLDLGGAQISVNPVTGTFTFTGNGVSTDLGGTGIFNPQGNVNIGGNLFVSGAVYIAGNTTTISTNNVVFNDALIYLANGNPTDFLDIGFVGNFTRSSLFQHTGFVRDATDGVWKLFEGVDPVPTTVVDFGSASYSTALIGNLVTRSNITVGGNTRLGGALLTSAGLGGDPGQYLASTGTGITWTTIDFSTLSDGVATTVTADSANVNVTVNTTAVASFGATSLVVTGDVYATQFIGNGSQLTGLPAGYSNVNAETFFASGTSTSAINITGNILAANINAGGVRQTTSSSAPSIASVGDQWYDSSTDIVFQYIYDGTNNFWIDISSVALNTNIATIQGTTLSITGNGTVGGNLTVSGFMVGQSTQALYADLAENYASDNQYEPGTVLIFGGPQEVTQSTTSHDPAIAGVVSTNPAYLMNSGQSGVSVALTGRVPCWVRGPINKGDRVVSSDMPGTAECLNLSKYQPGCIIGKSLETIENDLVKLIEVVVGRI